MYAGAGFDSSQPTTLNLYIPILPLPNTVTTQFQSNEGIGIESGSDNIYIRAGATYYVNDLAMLSPIAAAPLPTGSGAMIGNLPFSINAISQSSGPGIGGGYEYVLELPDVPGYPSGSFAIRIEDFSTSGLGAGNDKSYGVSVCITGHGSYFSGRQVMILSLVHEVHHFV